MSRNRRITAKYAFRIKTPEDLFEVLADDYKDLIKTTTDRHAIHFSVVAWHLLEWVWAGILKSDSTIQRRVFGQEFSQITDFKRYAIAECPELALLQDICNGSKHFSASGAEIASTGTPPGHGFGPMGIVMKDGSFRRFTEVADTVMKYWKATFSRINYVPISRDANGRPVPPKRLFGPGYRSRPFKVTEES